MGWFGTRIAEDLSDRLKLATTSEDISANQRKAEAAAALKELDAQDIIPAVPVEQPKPKKIHFTFKDTTHR